MTYPYGYGPEAGRFTADPYMADASGGPAAVGTVTTAVQPLIAVQTVQGSAGQRIASFGPAPSAGWSVRRVTVTGDAWTNGALFVSSQQYKGVNRPPREYQITSTYQADDDEYDASQLIYVPEGQYLSFWWATGPNVMTCRIEYQEGA